MAITQAVCTSFKVDLGFARHNFANSGGNAFKLSLYTSSATLGATTTAFTASNEVVGTGYTSGGGTLTNIDPVADTTKAVFDFQDLTFSTATITARGALIYNDTLTTPVADASCWVFDFGSDKTSTAADFVIQFPTPDAANAVYRIA